MNDIWVSFPDNPVCCRLTQPEFEAAIEQFRQDAIKLQKQTGADRVVYCTQEINNDGSIRTADHFILLLDADAYDRRTKKVTEQVYTVYRR